LLARIRIGHEFIKCRLADPSTTPLMPPLRQQGERFTTGDREILAGWIRMFRSTETPPPAASRRRSGIPGSADLASPINVPINVK
jgi:hypothetical protein